MRKKPLFLAILLPLLLTSCNSTPSPDGGDETIYPDDDTNINYTYLSR